MENGTPGSKHDKFEDAPRNINFVYNQLEHSLDTQLPLVKMKPEKYFLMGVFFFFAVGLVISLILLINGVERSQKATSVSASQVTTTITPVQAR